MNVVTIVVQVFLGLLFLMAGGTKLMGFEMQVVNFQNWGYPEWFRLFTGSWEVLGAVGMIWGIWKHKIANFAGLWLMVVMAGATYTHLFRAHDDGWRITVTLLLISGFVAYRRRSTVSAVAM